MQNARRHEMSRGDAVVWVDAAAIDLERGVNASSWQEGEGDAPQHLPHSMTKGCVSVHGEAMPNEGIALMSRQVDQSGTEEGHETTTYKMNWFFGRST